MTSAGPVLPGAIWFSVDHDLAQDHREDASPPVRDPGGLDVDVPALQGLWAVKVQPGVEEGVVEPGDGRAFRVPLQVFGVQVRLVGHVQGQLFQVVDVVGVGCDLVCKRKNQGF